MLIYLLIIKLIYKFDFSDRFKFFTLQQITYLVNCYEEKKITNLVNYSFYVTFFLN